MQDELVPDTTGLWALAMQRLPSPREALQVRHADGSPRVCRMATEQIHHRPLVNKPRSAL